MIKLFFFLLGAAGDLEFEGVELRHPYHIPSEELSAQFDEESSYRLELTCLDTYTLVSNPNLMGYMGYAAVPGAEHMFRSSLNRTIEYAKITDCKTINVLVGCPRTSPLVQFILDYNPDVSHEEFEVAFLRFVGAMHPSFKGNYTELVSPNYTPSRQCCDAWEILLPKNLLSQIPATCSEMTGRLAVVKKIILHTLVKNIQEASALVAKELGPTAYLTLEFHSDAMVIPSVFSSYRSSSKKQKKNTSNSVLTSLTNYYLTSIFHVIEALVKANVTNCGTIFDTFHMYQTHGSLQSIFTTLSPIVRHVQLSNISTCKIRYASPTSSVSSPSSSENHQASEGKELEEANKTGLGLPPLAVAKTAPVVKDVVAVASEFVCRSPPGYGDLNLFRFMSFLDDIKYSGWTTLAYVPSLSSPEFESTSVSKKKLHPLFLLAKQLSESSDSAHTAFTKATSALKTSDQQALLEALGANGVKQKSKSKKNDDIILTNLSLKDWYPSFRQRRHLSAGTLFACSGKQGRGYILLALDAKRGAWGPFYGRPDRTDADIETTAMRETTEESLGVLTSGNTLLLALKTPEYRRVFPGSHLFMVNLGVTSAVERETVVERFLMEKTRRNELDKSQQEVEKIAWFDVNEFYKVLVQGKKGDIPKLRKFFKSILISGMTSDVAIQNFFRKMPLEIAPLTELLRTQQQQYLQNSQGSVTSPPSNSSQSYSLRSVSSPM